MLVSLHIIISLIFGLIAVYLWPLSYHYADTRHKRSLRVVCKLAVFGMLAIYQFLLHAMTTFCTFQTSDANIINIGSLAFPLDIVVLQYLFIVQIPRTFRNALIAMLGSNAILIAALTAIRDHSAGVDAPLGISALWQSCAIEKLTNGTFLLLADAIFIVFISYFAQIITRSLFVRIFFPMILVVIIDSSFFCIVAQCRNLSDVTIGAVWRSIDACQTQLLLNTISALLFSFCLFDYFRTCERIWFVMPFTSARAFLYSVIFFCHFMSAYRPALTDVSSRGIKPIPALVANWVIHSFCHILQMQDGGTGWLFLENMQGRNQRNKAQKGEIMDDFLQEKSAALLRFRQDRILNEEGHSVLDAYANKWVAYSEEGPVDSAQTYTELVEHLKSQSLDPERLIIDRVCSDREYYADDNESERSIASISFVDDPKSYDWELAAVQHLRNDWQRIVSLKRSHWVAYGEEGKVASADTYEEVCAQVPESLQKRVFIRFVPHHERVR